MPDSQTAGLLPQPPPGVNVALRTAYGFNWNNAAGAVNGVGGQRADAATFGNIILSTISTHFLNGPGAFTTTFTPNTRKYLLFQFTNSLAGNQTQYGWIGMSAATYNADITGMSVSFTDWAYDNTGGKINAGALDPPDPPPSVPEPSTAVMGLISALVVGGAGLRRWRTSKPGNVAVSEGPDSSPQ